MFRSLSRFMSSTHASAALLIAVFAAFTANAQTPRRTGHETNATRQARIARQMQETYTHRWEVGGGGGYLRFKSGQYTQKNSEITFWMDTTYYLNEKLGITGELRGAYGHAKIGNTAFNIPNPQISEHQGALRRQRLRPRRRCHR
jgi:hypothetical protein